MNIHSAFWPTDCDVVMFHVCSSTAAPAANAQRGDSVMSAMRGYSEKEVVAEQIEGKV